MCRPAPAVLRRLSHRPAHARHIAAIGSPGVWARSTSIAPCAALGRYTLPLLPPRPTPVRQRLARECVGQVGTTRTRFARPQPRQARTSSAALLAAKRVHMISASRVLIRALERCHRRPRLASHRVDNRGPSQRMSHASLLHNAAFCEVAGRSLASSLCGRPPLRALRVHKIGVMQSAMHWGRSPVRVLLGRGP